MIVAVPIRGVVTAPKRGLAIKIVAGSLLDHVPPGVALLSVVDVNTHIALDPVIGAGSGFTVTVRVEKHPVPMAYDIVAVPLSTPVTMPLAETIATAVLLLVHVPPEGVHESVVLAPTHTVAIPVIAEGLGNTVIVRVT